MAISRAKKEVMVTDYAQKLSQSEAVVLSSYRGLTVSATMELRQRLREVGGNFQVAKNSLFRRSLEQAGVPVPEEALAGPTALSFCMGEVPAAVKALLDYMGENELLQVKGTIWGNTFLDLAETREVANLPSRDVLLAQLLGAVQGPMGGLVSILTAPLRELVQVLAARGEQGADGLPGPEAGEAAAA